MGNFGFTDVEGRSLASITISRLNLAGGETLEFSGTDVTVGQTIPAAGIPYLVYAPATSASGSVRSTFDFRVNDADNGTVAAAMTINVTAVVKSRRDRWASQRDFRVLANHCGLPQSHRLARWNIRFQTTHRTARTSLFSCLPLLESRQLAWRIIRLHVVVGSPGPTN